MTVTDLIQILQDQNPDAVVVRSKGDYIGTHKEVSVSTSDQWWRQSSDGNWFTDPRYEGETEIIVIE